MAASLLCEWIGNRVANFKNYKWTYTMEHDNCQRICEPGVLVSMLFA
jgi:hypothetical protein